METQTRPMPCPVDHEKLKRDRDQRFRACNYNGPQDDGEGGYFELWTCLVCDSTFGVPRGQW